MYDATDAVERTREEKAQLEQELTALKRHSGAQEALRQRLNDSEVGRDPGRG